MKRPTPSINLRELVILAIFAALMVTLQVLLAALPNIELVSFLIIILTLYFGLKALFSVYVFVLLEAFLYGLGIWWFSYLYVWPVLVLVVCLLRRFSTFPLWVVVSAIYGLLFGTLCSIPYFASGGVYAGISYIAAGIPFDLMHCAGNAALMLALYYPITRVMNKAVYRKTEK